MADMSLIRDDSMDDSSEGLQGDYPSEGIEDDLSLSPLLRVQKYAQSANIFDRQMVARIVQDLFKTAPAEILSKDLTDIMKILTSIGDESMLRADLLEQIPHIAAQAVESSARVIALRNVVSEYLIPLVVRNLGYSDTAVDKAAHVTLIQLIEQGFITKQQTEIQVCPSILALSKVETAADVNTGAITLMSKLAPLLGRDITERVFLKRFSELCTSQMFYVRKVCAAHLGQFCGVIGKEAFEKILLPSYINLCGDDIWGVRKACAEVAMFVSCACPPVTRKSTLAQAFSKLLQDECRWVRMSAFQTLGPFISTFADPAIANIGYNNMGDLVLVNNEGEEFLMNSSSSVPDNRPPLIHKFVYPSNSEKQEFDVIVNHLSTAYSNLLPDEEAKAEVQNKILLKSEPVNIEEEMDKILEELIDAVPAVVTVKDSNKDNLRCNTNSDEIVHCDTLADTVNNEIRQGIENVNIVVEEHSYCNTVSDGNKTISSFKETTTTNNDIKEPTTKDNQVNLIDNDGATLEDDLHLFNSYNYWYVDPELPLDTSVITDKQSPLEENIAGDIALHLEDLYSNISLSDSFSNSLIGTVHYDSPISIEEKSSTYTDLESNGINAKPEQTIVPQLLIDHFVSMTDPNLTLNVDNEMAYHCAYSLPAVALTLGKSNWHLLKGTVDSLAGDMQYKVRRTVASGLHELALILGPDMATENLTPLFDGFLKDLDEVRIGVLKHLSHFLKLISPLKRSTYLPRLGEFLQTDNESNWRFRHEFAKQLLLAVTLFKVADTAKHIGVMAIDLLCDKIAAVRQMALSLITEIIKYTSSEPSLTPSLLIKLAERFAHSKKWKMRQTFALLCIELLKEKAVPLEQFASEVMPHLLDLSWDPVANVRLVVAKCLSKYVIPNDYFGNPNNEHYESLLMVLRRLQADKDRDVRKLAEIEPVVF